MTAAIPQYRPPQWHLLLQPSLLLGCLGILTGAAEAAAEGLSQYTLEPRTISGNAGAVRTAQHDTYEVWEGTAEELISAALIEPYMLPGQPGRNKTMVTFNGCKGRRIVGPDYLQIRKASGGRYIVIKGRDPKEVHRQKMAAQAERRAATKRMCLDLLKKKDASHPASTGAHKIQAINTVKEVEQLLWDCFAGRPRSLFSYDQATLDRISALTEELCELAVNAPVITDAKRKEHEVQEAVDKWMADVVFPFVPSLKIVR